MTAEEFRTTFAAGSDLPTPGDSSSRQKPARPRRVSGRLIVIAIVAIVVMLVAVALIVFPRLGAPQGTDLRPYLVSAPYGTSPCTDSNAFTSFVRFPSASDRADFHNRTGLNSSGVLSNSIECWVDQSAETTGQTILVHYDRSQNAAQALTAAMTSLPADVSGADLSAIPGVPGETFTTQVTTPWTYTIMWVLSQRGAVIMIMTMPISSASDAAAVDELAAQQYERLAAVR